MAKIQSVQDNSWNMVSVGIVPLIIPGKHKWGENNRSFMLDQMKWVIC